MTLVYRHQEQIARTALPYQAEDVGSSDEGAAESFSETERDGEQPDKKKSEAVLHTVLPPTSMNVKLENGVIFNYRILPHTTKHASNKTTNTTAWNPTVVSCAANGAT